MSSNVDKRVVELDFDNSKFERNVKQSMGTLDKLKESLGMEGVSRGLDEVSVKFSAFEIAAITVISNITNRVVDLGVRLVKSLSIDNVSAGWQKFSDKTVSVATMASQSIKIAGKEITNYAEKMEAINGQLEKLNWFTDETSYNFVDMVDNIGKFTAAGVDLDKSVKAMMGIANWAALSGQNAVTASRAMYQLSQALSKGYVQLLDYKSIQNANMDTQEFRQTVLDTAVAMGELTKEGENFITKTGKKFTRNQFTEALSEKWFTSDVLTNSLEKYSKAVEKIYEISEETGINENKVIVIYGDTLDEFGLKAFKAAQEARTFTDTLNSIKDAVSTGWMATAEKIFGSYDDSKELWTDLSSELYDVFAEGGNFRNEVLSIWSGLDGRKDIFEHGGPNQGAFWNLYDSIIAIVDIIKSSWNEIFPKTQFEEYDEQVEDLGNKFKAFTERLRDSTARIKTFLEENQFLTNIFRTMFGSLKIVVNAINAIRYALDPVLTVAKDLISNVFDKITYYTTDLSFMEDIITSLYVVSNKLSEALYEIIGSLSSKDILGNFVNFLNEIFDIIKRFDIINTVKDSITNFFKSFTNNSGGLESVKRILNSIFTIIGNLWGVLKKIIGLITTYVVPVVKDIIKFVSTLAGTVLGKLLDIVAALMETLAGMIDLNKLMAEVKKTFQVLDADNVEINFNPFVLLLEAMKTAIAAAVTIIKALIPIIEVLVTAIAKVITWISNLVVKIFGGRHAVLKAMMIGAIAILTMFVIWIIQIKATIGTVLDSLSGVFDAIAFKMYASVIGDIAESFFMMALSIGLLSLIPIGKMVKSLAVMAVLSGIMYGFFVLARNLQNNKLKDVQKNINAMSSMIKKLSSAFIKMAFSFILIGAALKIISSVGNMSKAFSGIILSVGALITVAYVAKSLTKADVKRMSLLALVSNALSLALVSFASAMAIIGLVTPLLNTGKIITLTACFAALSGAFVGISKLLKSTEIGKLAMFSGVMMMFGVAMAEFSASIAILGALPVGKVWNGVAAISAFTAMMALIIKVVGIFSSLKLFVFASGMITLGRAMSIFAGIIIILSAVSPDGLDRGRKCIQTFIVMMALIVKVVGMFSSIKLNVFATGMILLGIAMNEFALTMIALSGISWSNIWKALIAMTAILGAIAGMMVLFKTLNISTITLIPFAFAMILLSSALNLFAISLGVLSAIPWTGLLKGLLMLVTGMTAVLIIANFIQGVVGALLLFSASMLAISASMLMLSVAFTAFVASLTLFAESFSIILETVLSAIVAAIDLIGEVVSAFANSFLDTALELMPKLLNIVVQIMKAVLKAIRNVIPDLLNTLGVVILSMLQFLRNNIGQYVSLLVEIIIEFLDALTSRVPQFVNSLVGFLTTFIVSSLQSLGKNIEPLITAALQFVMDFIDSLGIAIKKTAGQMVDTFINFGKNIMSGLWNGMVYALADLLAGIPVIGDEIEKWLKDSLEIHSPSKMTERMGVYLMEGLGKGMDEELSNTCETASDTMSEVISAVGETIQNGVDDDDLTITPVLDLSQVRAGTNSISSMMGSISGASVGVTSSIANSASREINRNRANGTQNQNGNVTNNTNNDSYNVTFNVTSNNPEELAEQLDAILQKNHLRANLAKGGV